MHISSYRQSLAKQDLFKKVIKSPRPIELSSNIAGGINF